MRAAAQLSRSIPCWFALAFVSGAFLSFAQQTPARPEVKIAAGCGHLSLGQLAEAERDGRDALNLNPSLIASVREKA